jgi:hypothetical protein
MPITTENNSVIACRMSVSFADFPRWHAYHLQQVPGTQQLEHDGASLLTAGFLFPQLETFIRAVCRWGGYAGIAGRILNRNTAHEIATRFKGTILGRDCAQPAASALVSLNHLSGLGTPSFASKHLRFIPPRHLPSSRPLAIQKPRLSLHSFRLPKAFYRLLCSGPSFKRSRGSTSHRKAMGSG